MEKPGLSLARGTAAGVDEAGTPELAPSPAIPTAPGPIGANKGKRSEQPAMDTGAFDDDEPRFDPAIIEPGRALALADFTPPAVGAGDRLVRFAYRLGLPSGALNPFRKRARTRLTATVANPLPGDAAAGKALRAGHFLIHGVRTAIADTEFAGPRLAPPFERLVHGFGWLADLEACAPRAQCTPVAERVLGMWLNANPRPNSGPAWNVGHAGHRLLAWLVHAPLLLSGNDKKFRARALHAIADTARWLDRHAHKAGDKLDEVAGWAAITAAGLLLEDGRARRLHGEAGLIKALGDLVGDDGGVLSRSPLCQIEAIELIVRLKACYAAVRADPPSQIDTILTLLVPPLLALLHGDGALGSWQGAAAVSAAPIEALVKASGVRTRPLRDARQWGYQRVGAGKSFLQIDAAPPPLARHAREGCASTLALEFSHGPDRLIVNCGGAAFAGGQIPLRLAQGLRATAAHSTLTIDDFNSTAVLINGKLGTGVGTVEVDRRTITAENGAGATRIETSHDGYVARYGLTHRRILILRDDGTELRGEDLLVATGRKGKRGTVGVALRFHLGPHIELAQGQDGLGVTLALPDGSLWQFRSGRDPVTIEDSLWADGQGRPLGTRQLVIPAKIPRSGETFSWLLKKMR
ncbi:heparinase II/III family protein [Novosphingobium sp. KCTC 2891]|uniref:heparinase II/III family protein n=1 Tax=Novosphingobium sp. KCTC 2891 TaxID=2989730 RepID=UPI0022216C0A|nr:heparinase II/III family protein [Novosphingobium sp. KCTC 2891]MCW1382273.1 heparinase II/III family protein [Novosphingobium sp. KCTC 2891]